MSQSLNECVFVGNGYMKGMEFGIQLWDLEAGGKAYKNGPFFKATLF